MNYETLTITVADKVATVTLNRPDCATPSTKRDRRTGAGLR
jgi:enoyl-CoA hydratase/carnithine racemase